MDSSCRNTAPSTALLRRGIWACSPPAASSPLVITSVGEGQICLRNNMEVQKKPKNKYINMFMSLFFSVVCVLGDCFS